MSHQTIRLKDWTRLPAGRSRGDGPYSGEAFRDDVLVPALRRHDSVTLDLNDIYGLAASWTEEVFGGLVRVGEFTPEQLRKRLDLSLNSALRISQIESYIADAA
ncbi:STAS-like domain-containing protein [Variovorax sp. CCNWLW225]|uniref:STAS-like domain-containing protein n=1 Tax=Variovorax sp. CCNWLW225 TaxID=3127462 RepID=UPI003077625C